MSIVQQYTGRHLTVPSDKLFAISAIAETSNDGSTDRYLAGIWMSHLPNGLMWNCKDLRPQIPSTSFVAPSWSWASVRGEITWTRTGDDEHDPQLEVLECSVELASDEAPYGAVKKGTLVFKNLLQIRQYLPIFYAVGQKNHLCKHRPANRRIPNWIATSQTLYLISMAIHSDERYLRLKWCVHRSVYDEEIKSGPTGLILASTDSVIFTRIGMFEFMSTIEDEDLNKELGMSPLSQEHIDEQQTAQTNASRDINPRTFWLI
jgi:hypothetical protein